MATSVSAKLDCLVNGHEGLAVIAPSKQKIQGVGRVLETNEHVLLMVKASRQHHRREGTLSFGELLFVVEHEKSLHARATSDQR